MANHIWAKTYRLTARNGEMAYLKALPDLGQGPNRAIGAVAEHLQPHVPAIVAQDARRGLFLFADHDATEFDRRLDGETGEALLQLYARLQGTARRNRAITSALPRQTCVEQLDRLMDLINDAAHAPDKARGTGNPFGYIPRDFVAGYETVFEAAEPLLRRHLAQGDQLAPTLNHCDLRAKNVARRDDGSLCIFDLDDAVLAPPGLSLHALFSGSLRVHLALRDGADKDAAGVNALQKYIATLAETGGYERTELRRALPAIACAGVFRYIIAFADYPAMNETTQASIGRNARRRMSDLLDVIEFLTKQSKDNSLRADLSDAMARSGREDRAKRLRPARRVKLAPRVDAQTLLRRSDAPGVFPSVAISETERDTGKITRETKHVALDMFARHGGLMIENAFSRDLINRAHRSFTKMREDHERDIAAGAARRVGNKRFMISLGLRGAFADPGLIASPFVLPILHSLLTRDAILGSLTAVASMPGSADQGLHRDNPPLFEEASTMQTPSFCIALIIPLIPLNATTGATRIYKGSHKKRTRDVKGMEYQDPVVELGSCYLMDSRLFHQGKANNSDQVRPILSLVYQRPWYRDHKNFKDQNPLIMADADLNGLPPEMRKLVAWAGEPS